jgi:hypothetical protein
MVRRLHKSKINTCVSFRMQNAEVGNINVKFGKVTRVCACVKEKKNLFAATISHSSNNRANHDHVILQKQLVSIIKRLAFFGVYIPHPP